MYILVYNFGWSFIRRYSVSSHFSLKITEPSFLRKSSRLHLWKSWQVLFTNFSYFSFTKSGLKFRGRSETFVSCKRLSFTSYKVVTPTPTKSTTRITITTNYYILDSYKLLQSLCLSCPRLLKWTTILTLSLRDSSVDFNWNSIIWLSIFRL